MQVAKRGNMVGSHGQRMRSQPCFLPPFCPFICPFSSSLIAYFIAFIRQWTPQIALFLFRIFSQFPQYLPHQNTNKLLFHVPAFNGQDARVPALGSCLRQPFPSLSPFLQCHLASYRPHFPRRHFFNWWFNASGIAGARCVAKAQLQGALAERACHRCGAAHIEVRGLGKALEWHCTILLMPNPKFGQSFLRLRLLAGVPVPPAQHIPVGTAVRPDGGQQRVGGPVADRNGNGSGRFVRAAAVSWEWGQGEGGGWHMAERPTHGHAKFPPISE